MKVRVSANNIESVGVWRIKARVRTIKDERSGYGRESVLGDFVLHHAA